jgi:ABC-type dipeptide/oligopeptide/nickel transport system permease component
MGRALYDSITVNDFPVTQMLVAIFAGIFILSVILTDVLYALVDPRVRLS